MSPGTARTMVQSLRLGQRGGRVRRNGVMEEVPLAHSWRLIDFAGGAAPAGSRRVVERGISSKRGISSSPRASLLMQLAPPHQPPGDVSRLQRRAFGRRMGWVLEWLDRDHLRQRLQAD
jgi:hypothetical protein